MNVPAFALEIRNGESRLYFRRNFGAMLQHRAIPLRFELPLIPAVVIRKRFPDLVVVQIPQHFGRDPFDFGHPREHGESHEVLPAP